MNALVLLLHGTNLNLLGQREPEVYGTATLDDHIRTARHAAEPFGLVIEPFQSNHEGELVEAIHGARGRCGAIVINPGAFTHYAWSLHDALAAFDGPVVELHLSNPNAREAWRHTSVIAPVATGSIVGFGGDGYRLAIEAVAKLLGAPGLMELTPMAVAERIGRLTASFGAAGCDALLVSDLVNIRYLAGFTGSAARLVVRADEPAVLVTDGRYEDQAARELAEGGGAARVAVGRSQQAQRDLLQEILALVPRVGLEAAHVSWADQQGYAELFAGARLVPTVGLVEEHRMVKDEGELARLQRAADIAGQALANVFGLLDEEPAEADFALALDTEMRRLGASGPSFETIVAGGPNAGLPHHRPDDRRIREGDLLVLDFGATVDGYHSDMTRTAMLGAPSAEQAELVAVVTEAQALGVGAVRDGVAAADVDAVCRSFITAAGWGERFTHGTGHGVGLRIHESPWVNATSTDMLVTGAVVTVEPGVYRGPLGGVRVEDSLVVLADGCRSLTTTPKDLSCLRSPPTSSRTG